MSFKIVPFSDELDLTNFYKSAEARGFVNNASKHMLVDCFKNEREKSTWILYYNNEAVGSVAAHSFDDVMGPNSYRIAARTCVFTDRILGKYSSGLKTLNMILEHQHPTSQFLIPACLSWVPSSATVYITSNENDMGSQRLVHKIFAPALEKKGVMIRIKDVMYRGSLQTVWQLIPDAFFKDLNKHTIWN